MDAVFTKKENVYVSLCRSCGLPAEIDLQTAFAMQDFAPPNLKELKMSNENLFNREFEQHILGIFLTYSEVFLDSKVAMVDFATKDHELIFKAIATVYEETKTTDPILVANLLEKEGELKRAGGANYIYELQAPIVECASAEFYEKEIKRLSQKREICSIMSAARADAGKLESDPEQIVAIVEEKFANLKFEREQINSYTALELSKMEITPVKWFIPDFLPSGLTILAGPPKIGKSFFCWNMALAITQGGIAFSSVIIPEKHNVTYLSLEDPPALLKDRLTMMSDNDSLPSNLHIIDDMQGNRIDAVGLKVLGEHLDKTNSEVLIIDTWKHVSPEVNVKGTSYDDDYKALIPIQKFAHRRNIALVLVTHTRKAPDLDNVFNQIQGSTGMQAACDTIMMLSHDSGSKTLHLSGRRIKNNQFAFTIEDGIWKLEGDAQEYHGSELKQEIIVLLKEAGNLGMSSGDIIDATGKNDKSVRSALRRMVAENKIVQPKKRGDYFYKDDDDDEQIEINF